MYSLNDQDFYVRVCKIERIVFDQTLMQSKALIFK